MSADEFEMYFRLLWLLVLFVGVLIISLCYLYMSMRRARESEAENKLSFSLVLEGQEAERKRIAAELHDTVLPNLKNPTAEAVTEAAVKVREMCGSLLPPDFARFNLKDALISLGNTFVKRTGLQCIVEIADDLDFSFLDAEQKLHLYRIVQEAFNNIEKHSKATQAMLIARYQNGVLKLNVSDNGVGLPAQAGIDDFSIDIEADTTQGGGYGMRIMRQRAALLEGSITIISEPGNGCMVCVEYSERNA